MLDLSKLEAEQMKIEPAPIDFRELGEEVMKYHKTLTAYVNGLLQNGFELLELVEPQPEPGLLEAYPEIMRDELRRPMMLLVSARKR